MRMLLDQLEKHPAAGIEEVMHDLADVRRQIATAPVLGWLPGQVNIDTIDAITVRLGQPEGERFFQRLWPRVWGESPFMSSFVQGILRLHRDPGAYVKQVGRGYPQVFRNFGRWTVERDGQQRALGRLEDVPAGCFAHDAAWLHYVAVSLVTLYDQAGHVGDARVIEADAGRGAAVFEFTWAA